MMKRSGPILLSLTACACSVPFEIVGLDAGGEGDADAGIVDAGARDSGMPDDAGTMDAGMPDGGRVDGGVVDGGAGGGSADGGAMDAGAMDAGAADGGTPDGGENTIDGGAPDGGSDPCTDPLSSGCCSAGMACGSALECLSPGQPICGGACFINVCSSCPPGSHCAPDACCSPSTICVADCTGSSCPEGQFCNALGECAPDRCTLDTDCPPFFLCGASSCLREPCNVDTECKRADGTFGFCVNQFCYGTEGMCVPPAP
jgi:hypothetical protein